MNSKQWWWSQRPRYNKGLIISGFIAFILYRILDYFIVGPSGQFEEIISETVLLGSGYLIMMIIANLLYTLGSIIDICFNVRNSQAFRERLFNVGYWLSFSLPILLVPSVIAKFPF